ncbi:hypothetical protein [Rhodomicrobium sp.]|uniref:hypothetical protein n=1 Tax=Rhodomicrobium sp. TaxID=2720632 RepID=UPI0039E6F4E4
MAKPRKFDEEVRADFRRWQELDFIAETIRRVAVHACSQRLILRHSHLNEASFGQRRLTAIQTLEKFRQGNFDGLQPGLRIITFS